MSKEKTNEDQLFFLRISKLKAIRKRKQIDAQIKKLNFEIAKVTNRIENERILLQRGRV